MSQPKILAKRLVSVTQNVCWTQRRIDRCGQPLFDSISNVYANLNDTSQLPERKSIVGRTLSPIHSIFMDALVVPRADQNCANVI